MGNQKSTIRIAFVSLAYPEQRRNLHFRHGFTLIELLVVIAIISLLTSILMPSLKKAQELARRVACSVNMKNINLAFNLYQNDYDGWFPVVRENYPPASGIWAGKLYNDYMKDVNAFKCPSVFSERFFIPNEAGGADAMAYGMEWWLGGSGGDGDIGQGHQITDILKPANTVIVGENKSMYHGYGVHKAWWPVPTEEWGWPDDDRHGGVSNILFVDGHVLPYTQDAACSDESLIWFSAND